MPVTEEPLLKKMTQITDAIGSYHGKTERRLDSIQSQLDAIDLNAKGRLSDGADISSLKKELEENESISRLLHDRKGRAVISFNAKNAPGLFERKTTITSGAVGYATSGVLPIQRIPGIVAEAREQLTIRDLLFARPTTAPLVDFVKVTAPMSIASPQTEGNAKAENAVTFAAVSERVKTVATWIPASKQILDDFFELQGFLESSLGYYVNTAEEIQLLSGDGTGENLHGLIPQASAFNPGLLRAVVGWNTIDIVGRAIQQVRRQKELDPTFVVVHPDDWWNMRLTKDNFGRYLLGDPQSVVEPSLFGKKVLATTNIAAGTFLVGSGSAAASQIRDRMELIVEISTEHSDYFTRNLVAIRAEKRLALVVERPASYISGAFSSSPQ